MYTAENFFKTISPMWAYALKKKIGGVSSVTVIVMGNRHSDSSSNPRWCCLHDT